MLTQIEAITLYESGLWEDMPVRERCWLMLESKRVCYPFEQFHEDLETCLSRPVWTHELALARAEIMQEFLGETEPPDMKDILNLIPEEKRILVLFDKETGDADINP